VPIANLICPSQIALCPPRHRQKIVALYLELAPLSVSAPQLPTATQEARHDIGMYASAHMSNCSVGSQRKRSMIKVLARRRQTALIADWCNGHRHVLGAEVSTTKQPHGVISWYSCRHVCHESRRNSLRFAPTLHVRSRRVLAGSSARGVGEQCEQLNGDGWLGGITHLAACRTQGANESACRGTLWAARGERDVLDTTWINHPGGLWQVGWLVFGDIDRIVTVTMLVSCRPPNEGTELEHSLTR
jgi:hypothetical protein